ncbi:TonB-dependent receptor [Proteiniphilum sp. X52]|uniref:TonB-dependent receptor n=1 Tax=Proteiniphilum sp. X52 TaxID=2382159 RepID=UPI000F0A6187|nr:TonB-dependent receptor [Proteiniphilum sp. X52]RNC65045.1 TonB-dependent receptor [Proteiniphilum sp. X52]
MSRHLSDIQYIIIWIVVFAGNSFRLPAQTISFPQEPMLSRMEKIANAGKENGQFVTYEGRFLEGITAPAFTSESADVEEWIRRSLENTPLSYRKMNANRFVIVRRPVEKQATGYLSGKITDGFGVALPGATVRVQALQRGTITGMNGDYSLALPSGSYLVQVGFMGYETARIQDVEVGKNRTTRLDIMLKESDIRLDEVVVTYTQPESTLAGALRAQRNTPYISSVLGSQRINRSPGTTVQDAMSLLPGISFDENHSQIIRGTGGRWNEILLDGIPLPNYDPSYKIFSFDLIPVALVDNIRLLKSSTPDIPVGFAGGITEIITKDIPEQNYVQANVSYQFNTISTFKNLRGRRKGSLDLIGFDDGGRGIPGAFRAVMPGIPRELPGNTTLFPAGHFAISDRKSFPPQHYNITIGRTYALREKGDRFGFVLSLSYRNSSLRSLINHTQRGRWDYIGGYMGSLNDKQNEGHIHHYNSVTGGMLNAGWQFGKNRISVRNVFTRSFDNDLTEVTARLQDISGVESNLSYQFFNYPTFSDLCQSKLEGQHLVGGVLLGWNMSHTFIQRERKDAAFSEMYKPLKDDSLLYFLHQHPELRAVYPASSGWYTTRERNFHVGLSLSHSFRLFRMLNKMTIGYDGNHKHLRFISNEALYSYENGQDVTDPSSRVYQVLERNSFKGDMIQHLSFLMFEHRWEEKMRFVWGVRGDYEDYRRITANEQTVPRKNRKWYASPSANIVYMPQKNLNVRLSYQRSVIRPKLADYIPYPVYDTYLLGTSVNRAVFPSTVQAVDFLIEKYIGSQDIVSAGLFYRHIDRPIERMTYLYRYDERMYVLQNSDKADSYGFEAEIRKHLDFVGNPDFLRKTQLSAGFVLTRSSVKGKRVMVIPEGEGETQFAETESTQKRPLSGQTPYLFRAGISYTDKSLHANILFNRSGRQLFLLGENAYQHEYRAPFHSVEASISYRFPKSGIGLKLSGRNLLNVTQIFYTNTPDDYVRGEHGLPTDRLLPGKTENYDKGHDPIVHEVKNGQSFMISLSRTF